MADVLYFNGRFTTTEERVISVEDRGFQFGDAVYETLKFLRKTPLLYREHFRRLSDGLAELRIVNPWDLESWTAMLDDLLARTLFDDGVVYVQVTRGESERAHFYREDVPPTAVAYSRRFVFPDAVRKELGIRMITTPDLRWMLCNVKTVNLLGNVIAKAKAREAGADEALFVGDGVVREAASSSFFAVSADRLITHPADCRILPGTIRDRVISLAIGEKIRVDERPLREEELLSLDEAFITSTTQSVMPVSEIDGRIIGNSRRGVITTRLQSLYDAAEAEELASNRMSRASGWRR